jgi:secreted Zn-dependent insulinase-like peptidase
MIVFLLSQISVWVKMRGKHIYMGTQYLTSSACSNELRNLLFLSVEIFKELGYTFGTWNLRVTDARLVNFALISGSTTSRRLSRMEQGSSEGDPAPTLRGLSEKSFTTLNQAIAHTTDTTADDLRITLEDERGRLRVWASNLGALQQETSRKSLDYRLRDAPLMRTTVALGLEDLHSSTDRGALCRKISEGSFPRVS